MSSNTAASFVIPDCADEGSAAPRFDLSAVRAKLAPALVACDDVVDAVACLVAARRTALGHAIALPAGRVERDRRGLRMEITA